MNISSRVLLIIMFFSMEGYMSEVFYKKVTIDEIIKQSSVIIEVSSCKPFSSEKIIPIHPDQKKYPPYHQITFHYQITTVLYDENQLLSKGQKIDVDPSNASDNFESHRMYYLENYSESPIVSAYRPQNRKSSDPEGRIILFLQKSGKDNLFRFTFESSFEDITMKDEIIRLIQKIK
jgi:hypothetical protein